MKCSSALKALGRTLRVALLACGLVAALTGQGCNSSDPTCGGHLGRSCQSLGEECLQTASCARSPARCGSRCEQEGDQTICGSYCKWDGSRCSEPCAAAKNEADCGMVGSRCSWTGTECATPCAALATQEQCFQAAPGSLCVWITCEGKPQPCESFSGNECPTSG